METYQIEIKYRGRKLKLSEVKCPMCGEAMLFKNIDYPQDGEELTLNESSEPRAFFEEKSFQKITMRCPSGCVEEMRFVTESVARLGYFLPLK